MQKAVVSYTKKQTQINKKTLNCRYFKNVGRGPEMSAFVLVL